MTKINEKILSIPPYISTSWKNIKMLHMKESNGSPLLVIVLQNESVIEVPQLAKEVIEQIFEVHSKFIEQEEEVTTPSFKPFQPTNTPSDVAFSFGLPFNMSNGDEGANLGSILQHNSDQKNTPDLPPEILSKVTTIAKTLGMDIDQMNIPKAEPHCNCVYCQVARAFQNEADDAPQVEAQEEEEAVSDDDLRFRDWDIKQEGDNLYLVTNPLNQEEHYQVFLGSPVGCTCGQKNCEHIQVVLKS